MKNKFQFLSLSNKGGKAKFRLMQPFGETGRALAMGMREALLADIRVAATKLGEEVESLGVGVASQYGAQPAPITFTNVSELLPKPTDYYYKDYRALSATLAPCYGLDFSTPGVLEAAVQMLKGQTVYKDHWFYSVDNWVGVVSESAWDGKDDAGVGVPGINAKLKLDSVKDPMLIRGVACEPPAVHSCSVTVLFEFEFSHSDLVEQGRFWQLLGEEVEGEIVRLIVTAILGFWELSLVFQGAQDENKQLPATVPVNVDSDNSEAELGQQGMGTSPQQQREGSQTVKLTVELKQKLGLGDHQGEDVPDAVLLPALTRTTELAATGETLLTNARAECLRLATLAEGGPDSPLPEPIANMINKASAQEITELTKMYEERAAAQFTHTCEKCGAQMSAVTRSSVEKDDSTAGTTQQMSKPLPRVTLH